MTNRRNLAALLAALPVCLGSSAGAQAPPKPPESVLRHVPSDCLGFAVVRNVKDCTSKVDAFLQAVGLPNQQLPDVLGLISRQVGLGEGFDPNGGFAAVFLDPQQYGADLVTLIAGPAARRPAPAETAPLPLVLLVAGKDPARMFAAREPVREGKLVRFTGTDKKPTYCLRAGGYVALGPHLEAVRTVAGASRSILGQLSESDKAFLAANDLAAWVDFRMLSPILDAGIARARAGLEAKREQPRPADMPMILNPAEALVGGMGGALNEWRDQLQQIGNVKLGLRFAATGISVDARAAYLPDSAVGQALAAYRPAPGPLLRRLVGMPYAVAFAVRNPPEMPQEWSRKRTDRAFAEKPFKDLPEEVKAKLRRVSRTMDEQIRGLQLWVGPSSGGAGALRVACVIECGSAGEVRRALADGVAAAGHLIREMGQSEGLKNVSLAYKRAAVALARQEADAIDVDSSKMSESGRKELKALLGEGNARLLIAQADEKTLVVTLGGGKAFLAAAVRTAAGSAGKLYEDPALAKSLAGLPAKPLAVGFVNARNIQAIIKAVRAAGGRKPVPFEIKSERPFAGALYIKGTEAGLTLDLPADTLSQVVQAVTALIAQQVWEDIKQEAGEPVLP